MLTKLSVQSSVMVRAIANEGSAPGGFDTLGASPGRRADRIEIGPIPPRAVLVVPFGTGIAGNAFNFRVVGIRQLTPGGCLELALFEGLATLGSATGSDTAAVASTERFAVSIVPAAGVGVSGVTFAVSASGAVAQVAVDSQGCREFAVRVGPGNVAQGNALVGSTGE